MSATRPTIDINDATLRFRNALAMADDTQVAEGKAWYARVRQQCGDIAAEYGHSHAQVSAIVAIFSSMMPWERNIPAARMLLDAWASGIRNAEDMPRLTRNHACVRKAVDILKGARPEDTIVKRGPSRSQSWKTLCFYFNISGKSTRRATIDVHMYRVLTGDLKSTHRPEGLEYLTFEAIVQRVSREFGYRPCEGQAIAWLTMVFKPA